MSTSRKKWLSVKPVETLGIKTALPKFLAADFSIALDIGGSLAGCWSETHYLGDFDAVVVDDGYQLREKLLWILVWQ